jgi:hypothetical protein
MQYTWSDWYSPVEAGYNTSTVVPASRKGRQNGNPVSYETVRYGLVF